MGKNTHQRRKRIIPLIHFLFIFLFGLSFSTTYSWARPPLLVVTDIDDTLKVSRIISRGDTLDQAHQLLLERDAFSGSRILLDALDREGAKIFYLSAAPKLVGALQKTFLKKNHFPQREHLILRSSTKEDTFQYKVNALKSLKENHPDHEMILLGDNAEKDVAAYEVFVNLNSHLTIHTFIHELYSGAPSAPIALGQIPFLTFAEVSVYLESMGIIGGVSPLIEHETLVDLSHKKTKENVLPEFVEIGKKDLERLESALPSPLTTLFKELAAILHRLQT